MQSCPGGRGGEQRYLTVLVRQRPWREAARQPRRDIVTEDQSGQDIAAGTPDVLADRQYTGQHLHCGLAGYEAQAFAQLDRPPGNAVEQCCRARVMAWPTLRENRCTAARGVRQSLAQLSHLGPLATSQNDPQRVQQHKLCVPPHGVVNILPSGLRDKLRQLFDLPAQYQPPSYKELEQA